MEQAFQKYISVIQGMLEEVLSNEAPAIEQAAQALTKALAGGGGFLYVFGTGHGHMMAEELFYRAGGLARVVPILDPRAMLHESASGSTAFEREAGHARDILAHYPMGARDVLIVASNSGRNALTVEMALAARARGCRTVALTSLHHSKAVASRHPSGQLLYQVCDIVLDNHGQIGDAALQIGGRQVCPTSTALNAAILQAVVAQVAQSSAEQGLPIEFFESSNVDGGDAHNQALIDRYCDIIEPL